MKRSPSAVVVTILECLACSYATACITRTPPQASIPSAEPTSSASPTLSGDAAGPSSAPQERSAAITPVADAGRQLPAQLIAKPLALPGATAPVSLDYVAYERAHARVWVPVGDTGSVDVLDVVSGSFARVDGFKSVERNVHGKKRMMGPSAVAVGDGYGYVGNRGTAEVCAIDTATLKLGSCIKLPSATDGVAYVASAKEVWVTTPHDDSITILDASKPDTLKAKATIKLDGAPEGYAVDDSRGLFYTNLEDKDRTVVIDTKTRKLRGTPWKPDCGPKGPRGIAADVGRGFVFVACTDQVHVLDAKDGTILSKIDTGDGVDNIDWLESHRLLYVGAAKAATLSVVRIDAKGQATLVATGPSAEGARNAVADASGNAYLPDPSGGRLLVFAFTP